MLFRVLALLLIFPLVLFANDGDSLKKELSKNLSSKKRLELLDTYTKLLAKENSPELVSYLRQTVELAITLGQYDLASVKGTRLVDNYRNQGKIDSATYYLDRLLEHKDDFKDLNSLGDVLLKKGGISFRFDNYDDAIKYYSLADSVYKITQDTLFRADANLFCAQAYLHKGAFVKGMTSLKVASNLYLLANDYEYHINTLIEMASYLSANGMTDKAIDLRKDLITEPRLGDEPKIAIYGNQAIDYRKLNDHNMAFKMIQEMEALIEANTEGVLHNYWQLYLHLNYIAHFIAVGDFHNADLYLDQFYKLDNVDDSPTVLSESLLLRSKLYFAKKNYPDAIRLANEYLTVSNEINNMANDIEMKQIIYQSYQKLGKVEQALATLEQLKAQEDSLFNTQKTNTFLYLQSEFESTSKQLRIKNQEIEIGLIKSQAKLRYILFALLIALIGLFTAFFYIRSRKRAKALTLEIEANKTTLDKNIKQLNEQIAQRVQLEKKLESISEKYHLAEAEKEDLILSNPSLVSNDQWEEFKDNFVKVYPLFFSKLRKLDQPITNAEERLLSLEKLNFKDDEIAKTLGISKESVAKTRYRLRKKMGLDKETNLISFLENN